MEKKEEYATEQFPPAGTIPPAGVISPPPYESAPKNEDFVEDEIQFTQNVSGFESNDIRRMFVRKVYTLLFAMLSLTGGMIALFILTPSIRDWVLNDGGYVVISIGWSLFIFFYLVLVCGCCGIKKRYPLNIVLLFLLAGAMGMALGATCCFFEFDVIVAAGLGTAGVVGGVTLLTFWTSFDITKFTHILFMLPLAFMFTWIWFPIIGGSASWYTWMAFAVAMMTGFLAWDTKVLIGGGRVELSPDQYIEAVVQLYYDIVYIFYYLLLIFARD